MKEAWFSAIISLSSFFAFPQNTAPSIHNLSVSSDEGSKQITVTFDLADSESDDAEIIVTLSDDWGATFLAEVLNVQGDAGYPVSPGSNKRVTFKYNSSLQPAPGWMVKVVADDRQPVDIQQMADRVDSLQLRENLSFIEGIRHYQADPVHLEEVKDFIESRFRQNGLLTYRQNFIHNNYDAANIIGYLPGLKNERVTYIIGAHFDSVNNSPGADDNGSGTAGVLEAARILSQYSFEHTIKFIGFDFEETSSPLGGLTGSLRYVSEGIKSHEQIEGVFNLEMIGYYSQQPNSQQVPAGFSVLFPVQYQMVAADSFRGNFVVNTAIPISDSLKEEFDSAAARHVPALKVVSVTIPDNITYAPDFWRSDHASFWLSGYKALMLTDGANFRNHNYHTPHDTLGTLNFTFMSNIVKATVASVAAVAKPVHASAAAVHLFDTGIEGAPADCQWQAIQSESVLAVRADKNCAEGIWTVCLYDAQGRMIFKARTTGREPISLTTSRLPAGLYLFIAGNGKSYTAQTVMLR